MSHPELEAEQAYVDHAYACLERMRELVVVHARPLPAELQLP